MSPKRDADDPVRKEVDRMMDMLRIFVRALGYGNVEIARRTGIPHANVGRYFRGESRVPLDFVVATVYALGLKFAEFFEMAYPDRPAEPTAARKRIERILEILPARRLAPAASSKTPPPPATPPPEPEPPQAGIDKILEDLRREVTALIEAQKAGKEAAR
jgi:hypothetical protein